VTVSIGNWNDLTRIDDETYLNKIDLLLRDGKLIGGKHRSMNIQEACECVVAEWGLGVTFEKEVERFRQAWLKTRTGF
jgi:hypothetical protein